MELFSTIIGSKLHGFDTETSDMDIVTVYADPLRRVLSLHGDAPKGKQNHGENDDIHYELRHFARLLVKGNPTVFEALNSNLRLSEHAFGTEMTQNMFRFIDSTAVYNATRGYVHSTMKEASNGDFTPIRRGKKALASLRVLDEGTDLLKYGTFDCKSSIARDFALELKKGNERAIVDAQTLVGEHLVYFDALYLDPNRPVFVPDIDWINDFLFRVYTMEE